VLHTAAAPGAIVTCMPLYKRMTTVAALLSLLGAGPALGAAASAAAATTTSEPTSGEPTQEGAKAKEREKPVSGHRLLDSHELWATIDVCSPKNQLDTVGVRGSMPGNGAPHDKMFMSFRLQYMDATSKRWVDLVSGSTPTFVPVGGGGAARQDGQSFQLVPGKTPATLRGVVDFEWRRGGTVLASAARPTTSGRKSLAGADPKSFSAATCVIS
jgi:hypothetical protein